MKKLFVRLFVSATLLAAGISTTMAQGTASAAKGGVASPTGVVKLRCLSKL